MGEGALFGVMEEVSTVAPTVPWLEPVDCWVGGQTARGACPRGGTVVVWFSHLLLRLGAQFEQGLPVLAQMQPLQRPLPLHRQH